MRYLTAIVALLLLSISSFAQSYKMEGNEVVFNKSISFKKGSSELSADSKKALADVKQYLEDKSYVSLLRIEGHSAGESDDQATSEKRAIAIGKWLTDNGIDCKRLIMVGFGNTKLVAAGNGEANTRIVFANAELRGRAIGGMPVDGGGKVAAEPCR